MLKWVRKSHDHKKTRISQSIIMMGKATDERVIVPPTVNILESLRAVTAPVLKALASVGGNLSSRGGGWRQFMVPRCLLGKVGYSLGV